MVDAKYRFIWASCGYPGNSHDPIIMQSITLWKDIVQGKILPRVTKNVGGVDVPPLIVGDSVFPFQAWPRNLTPMRSLLKNRNISTTA